jgi:hypothetical protein
MAEVLLSTHALKAGEDGTTAVATPPTIVAPSKNPDPTFSDVDRAIEVLISFMFKGIF